MNGSITKDELNQSDAKFNYIDGTNRLSAVYSDTLKGDELKTDKLIQASVWFYGPQPDVTALVICFENNGKIISENEARIRKFADHNFTWNRVILQQLIPPDLPSGTVLKVYVDNKYNSEKFYLDDFQVDFIKK